MGVPEPAIRIKGLRVERGGRVVLPNVSLAVSAGRVTGVLGPSGSGKTPLIRSIVGVQIVLALPLGAATLRWRTP